MKSIFLNLVRAIARYVSQVAASESGELLSVRRKWHLLEAERYARLEAETTNVIRKAVSTRAASTRRCATRRIVVVPDAVRHI